MPDVVLPEAAQDFILELVEKNCQRNRREPAMTQAELDRKQAEMLRKSGFALALCAVPKYITAYKKENENEMPSTANLMEFCWNMTKNYDGMISDANSQEFQILCEEQWKGLLR